MVILRLNYGHFLSFIQSCCSVFFSLIRWNPMEKPTGGWVWNRIKYMHYSFADNKLTMTTHIKRNCSTAGAKKDSHCEGAATPPPLGTSFCCTILKRNLLTSPYFSVAISISLAFDYLADDFFICFYHLNWIKQPFSSLRLPSLTPVHNLHTLLATAWDPGTGEAIKCIEVKPCKRSIHIAYGSMMLWKRKRTNAMPSNRWQGINSPCKCR